MEAALNRLTSYLLWFRISREGMTMPRLRSLSSFTHSLLALLMFLVASITHAGTFTDASTALSAPAASSTGNYTVSFKTQAWGTHYLQEKKDSGSWSNIASYFTASNDYQTVKTRNVSVSGRTNGTYSYRVKFLSGENGSGPLGSDPLYSNIKVTVVSVVPGIPSSISATAVSGNEASFVVNWGTASGTVSSYQLEQQMNGGAWYQVYSGAGLSKTFSGHADGSYNYRVRACNSVGCGSYKTTSSAYVVSSPTSATTSAIHSISDSHKIDWAASSGSVDSYQLYRKFNDNNWTLVYEGLNLSATFTGLADGHYQYWVRACNTEASITVCSNYQASVRLTLSAVGIPVSFNAPSGDADGVYTVSWQAGEGTATTYTLQEQVSGGVWATIQDTLDTSKVLSGKTDGSYGYRVRGCNAGGCSDYTAAKTVIVKMVGQPGNISGPSALQEVDDFTLSWGAASGTVTRYELQEQPSGGNWSQVYSGPALSKAFVDHAFGTFNYRVRACNDVACGAYTPIKTVSITITVPPQAAPAPYDALGNLSSLVSQAELDEADGIGSVGGSFRVDESGAATYSIPLATVKGTAGVVPQLSLEYSSQAGNGLVGKGWSLGGLSAISRCRQTLFQDKQAKAITWGTNDRFCLDGQRLLLETGTYGAPNSTYKTEIDSFATVTAVGGTTGQPDYWLVTRKDGSVSQYGGTGNVDAELEGRTSAGGITNNTLSWALNYFDDSVGNRIDYDYADDSNGQRLTKAKYAYGTGSTEGAYLEFVYENRPDDISGFVAGYSVKTGQRLKTIKSYNGANLIRQYNLAYLDVSGSDNSLSRLESVQECAGAVCLPKTIFDWAEPAIDFGPRVYAQTNDIYTEIPVIGKQGDFNGDGLMDLVFAVADVQDSDVDYTLTHSISNGTRLVRQTSLSITLPDEDHGKTFAWHVIDYNNDGYSDVIRGGGGGNWKVHLSNGSRLTNTTIDTGVPTSSSLDASFLDLNSDGLTDFLRDKGNGTYGLRFMEQFTQNGSLATRFSTQEITLDLDHSGPSSTAGKDNVYFFKNFGTNPVIGDFDGDGNVDFVGEVDIAEIDSAVAATFMNCVGQLGSGYIQFCAAVQNTTVTYTTNNLGVYLSDGQGGYIFGRHITGAALGDIRVADVNADGLTDYLLRNSSNVWKLYLNTGTGFVMAHNLSTIPNYSELQFLDYNEDGYQDLIYPSGSTYHTRMYNPETKTFKAAQSINITYSGNTTNETLYFMDVNGDNHPDSVRFVVPGAWGNNKGNADTYVRLSNRPDQVSMVIDKITNGLGAETVINYSPLSDSSMYTAGSEANNLNWGLPTGNHSLGKLGPVFDSRLPIYLVSQVSSSAPKGGTTPGSVNASAKSSIGYYYGEARLQASGRGFLGFEKIKTVDEQTGIETTTTYRQDFPFIGHPLKTEVRSAQGHLLSEAENTWKLKGYASSWGSTAKNSGTKALGPLQPYISQSVEKTYDLVSNGATAGALLQTVTTDNVYDDYGNPTQITVTTAGGGKAFRKVTNNTYLASGLDALYSQSMGRLSQTTVTSERDENGDSSYELSSSRTSSFTYYTSGALKGLLATETVEPGSSAFKLTTSYSYDSFGNKVRAVVTDGIGNSRCNVDTVQYDASGRYADFNYDCLGRLTSQVMSRNAYGEPLEVRSYLDAAGTQSVSTYFRYTDRGLRYFEASDNGAWKVSLLADCSSYTCPADGSYLSLTRSAGGGQQREFFDLLGRSIKTSTLGFNGIGWAASRTEYDNLGRVKYKSEPHYVGASIYWSTFSYDILGRAIQITLPDASQSTMAYNGFSTVTTNDLGQSNTELKNALGETVQVTDHLSGYVLYRYDAQGNLEETQDNAGNIVHLDYDLLGRKTAMNDPDKGAWSYEYNGFGELITQTDAKGQSSVMTYDALGRMSTRIDRRVDTSIEGNTSWVYDTAANGLGQLDYVQDTVSGYVKALAYDGLGRLSETVTSLGIAGADGDHYEKVTYDQYGRTFQQFDAARNDDNYDDNGVLYRYNSAGYQYQLTDATYVNDEPRSVYQYILSMDARGQVTSEQLGNGVTTTRSYDSTTGRIDSIQATSVLGAAGDIQQLSYQWDTLGNLTSRVEQSGSKNLSESFTYDGLNRLKTQSVVGQGTVTLSYDSLGNITSKSDVGAYSYGAGNAGPHAVTSAGGTSYQYDANGNNTSSSDGRTISYTTFDKAASVSKGAHITTFAYGPDRKRYKRTDMSGDGVSPNLIRTTLYIGSVEKITLADGSRQVKRYLGGIAIETESYDGTGAFTGETKSYLHHDHLGSIDVITNALGQIEGNGGEMSFDAWGQRRSAITWEALSDQIIHAGFGVFNTNPITTRGFTGHEMMDDVGIIHMNGRIYDAKLGRFLQADPYVQSPKDTQSLNRYSYVRNNPLNATDPSGYFLSGLFKSIKKFAGAITAIALGVWAPWGIGLWQSFAYGAIAGGVGAGVNGGNILQGALIGGVSAAAFYSVAKFSGDTWGSGIRTTKFNVQMGKNLYMTTSGATKLIALQATAGGVMAKLQGGKFGHGFISAGLTKVATPGILSLDNLALESIASGVVGGTASELTGGKFANGATAGAFLYAFNACSSGNCKPFWDRLKEAWFAPLKGLKGHAGLGLGAEIKPSIGPVKVVTGGRLTETLECSGQSGCDIALRASLNVLKVNLGNKVVGLGFEGKAVLDRENTEFSKEVAVQTEVRNGNQTISGNWGEVGVSATLLVVDVGVSQDYGLIYREWKDVFTGENK